MFNAVKLKADAPVLDGIVVKQVGKEDELKQLKSELAALYRKISAELKPCDAEEAARAKVVTPTKDNGEPLDPPELIGLPLGSAKNPNHRRSRKRWWPSRYSYISQPHLVEKYLFFNYNESVIISDSGRILLIELFNKGD